MLLYLGVCMVSTVRALLERNIHGHLSHFWTERCRLWSLRLLRLGLNDPTLFQAIQVFLDLPDRAPSYGYPECFLLLFVPLIVFLCCLSNGSSDFKLTQDVPIKRGH